MISKTILRYVWLINTLLEEKSLTFEEINLRYAPDPYPLRSFHEHRKGIKELFGVEIKCTTTKPYRYSIANPEALNIDKTRKWLLESFAMMGRLEEGYTLKDRIVFEEYVANVIIASKSASEPEAIKASLFNCCPWRFTYCPRTSFTTIATTMTDRKSVV